MVAPSWGSFKKPNDNISKLERREDVELQKEIPGAVVDQEKPEGEKPQWGNFKSPTTYQGEPDPTADEDMFGYIARNAAQLGSRIGEQVLGARGNIEKFARDTLANVPESGGVIGWGISKLIGEDNWKKLIKGNKDQQVFPTSQKLREVSEKVTGGYTKPKTKGEEKLSEFVEDVGSTLRGARAGQTARQLTTNHLLIPAAANVTKNVVKDLGFGDDKANLAKMAVWLPLSLANNINASRYASDLMNEGRNAFNPNLRTNGNHYQNQLNRVSNRMLRGDPRSQLAQQQIAGIEDDIANGRLSMRDLMTRYDALNAAKRDRGLFELGRSDRGAAIRNINEVRDVVRDQIRNLGVANPRGLQAWENGVQAWATIHRSNAITNWVQNTAKGPYAKFLSGPAAALFGVGSFSAYKAPIIAGPASAAIPAAYKTGQTLYRMWNDPRLANYYWNAIGDVARDDLPAFLNNYHKLNKGLEKSEPSKPNSKSKEK